MASRSQMRLAQITGSLDSTKGALTALNEDSLQGVMDHLASAIARITGYSDFHNNEVGSISQNLDLTGSLDVSANAVIDGNLSAAGDVDFTKTGGSLGSADFDVAGYASFGNVIHGANNIISLGEFQGDLQYSASAGAGIDMTADFKNDANVEISLNVAYAQSLFAEADTLSIDMGYEIIGGVGTFSGSVLVNSDALQIGSSGVELKPLILGNRTFQNDVTISGDLYVNGTTTYVNTDDLWVKDAKIVISSGSVVADGAGIYLGNDSSGENIRWSTADDGKWIASDKFAADTLQALDLNDAIVWADASGNLVEITATQFGGYLTAGAGIDSVANGQIDATPYVAGTGVTITNFTASIGQPVATTDAVEFAGITDTSLSINKLVGSDGSSALVSKDLFDFVAGTTHQVNVADDTAGGVTLSLPQNIHSGASPEFAALNLSTHGDLSIDASNNLVIDGASAGIVLADSYFDAASFPSAWSGTGIEFASAAASWEAFDSAYGEVSLLDAIVAAGQGDQYADKYVFEVSAQVNKVTSADFGAPASGGSLRLSDLLTDFDAATRSKRIDVYVNGQLMREGSGKDYQFDDVAAPVEIDFSFNLEADDIVQMIVR